MITRLFGLLFCVALALPATRLSAQDEDEGLEPWKASYFPYLSHSANEFPLLGFRYQYQQAADYFSPLPYARKLSADAAIGPKGSRFLVVRFRAPGFRENWRLAAGARASRAARFGFFGLGNDATFDGDAENPIQPFFYRLIRTRYLADVEVTRRLRPHLHAALYSGVVVSRLSRLPGPSTFRSAFGDRVDDTDVNGRFSLIFDTRDTEYNTHRGIFIEGGAQLGSGGDGYTRLFAIGRGYWSVREGTVVAARLAASGMGGSPSLNSRFELPAWENPIDVLGGEDSHRGLKTGRVSGRHVLFGNLEVRHDLLNVGDFGALTLIAFLDAGRVFEAESFELTTDDMRVGGGGGVAIRLLRSTIVPFNFATGPDGFEFSVGGGWMF